MVDNFQLQGDLRRTLPGKVSGARATLHFNSDDGSWVNTADHAIHLAGDVIPLAADQTFDITLPSSTAVPGLQFEVRVEYSNDREPGTWRSGWFSMTEDTTLDERAQNSSLNMTPSQAAQLSGRIDALEAGGVGGGGGGSALIVSPGGTVDLNETLGAGATLFYQFTGAAVVEGIPITAGFYAFLRDPDSESGWSYWIVSPPAELPVPEGGGGDPGDPVETTPQQPTWNDSLRTYVIPTVVGVQYKKGGVNIAAGTYSTTSPTAEETITITAVEKPGFFFPDGVATSFPHTFPLVTDWTTAFSDTLLAPTGRITARTGWTVTNEATGPDDIVIDASGVWLTGNTTLQRTNAPADEHDETIEYDLSDSGIGQDRMFIDVARGYQPHRHILRREDSGSVRLETWYDNTLNGGSNFLTGLPLAGTFRAESDGLYVFAYLNGTKIAEAPHDPSLLGGYPPVDSGVTLRGWAVNSQKTRAKNLVVRTKS